MAYADQLRASAVRLRTGAGAVSSARQQLDAVPDALAQTVTAVGSASPGSDTSSAWARVGRHCALAVDAQDDSLRAYADHLLATAALLDDVERRIAAASATPNAAR